MSTKAPVKGVITTEKTEVIIGQSVNSLKKAVTELSMGFDLVKNLAEEAEKQQSIIKQNEDKIAGLAAEFDEKKRIAEVNLELAIKSNQDSAITSILAPLGKIVVVKAEHDATITALTNLQRDFDSKLSSEVAKMKGILEAGFNQEKKLLEAQNNTATAQLTAELSQMKDRVAFLNEQVDMWKEQLISERQASIERSKSSAVGTINIPKN